MRSLCHNSSHRLISTMGMPHRCGRGRPNACLQVRRWQLPVIRKRFAQKKRQTWHPGSGRASGVTCEAMLGAGLAMIWLPSYR